MFSSKEGQSFDFHRLKAELFSEVVKTVNSIFDQREALLYGVQSSHHTKMEVPEQRIMGELKKQEIMLESKIKQLSNQIQSLSAQVKDSVQHFSFMKSSIQNLGQQLSKQADQMSKDLEIARGLLIQQSKQFQKYHLKFKENLKTVETEWKNNFTNLNLEISEQLRRLGEAEAKIKSLTFSSESQFSKVSNMDLRLEEAGQKVLQHDAQVKKFVGYYKKLDRLMLNAAVNAEKLRQLQNFIDKYEPIYNYVQISQALFAISDDLCRRRLQIFDKQTLQQFAIVTSNDTGIPNLKLKVLKYKQLLGNIIIRNKPYEYIPPASEIDPQRAQNIYQLKIEKEMTEFKKQINVQILDVQNTLHQKQKQINRQLMLDLTQNTQIVSFRIDKTQDKIERLTSQLRKIVQVSSQRILAQTVKQKPPTEESEFNIKFEEMTKKIRNTAKSSFRSSRGSQTQRYSGLHKREDFSIVGKSNGSIISSLQESQFDIRRKSLVDMRRNRVSKT